jgi:hypothetical protein
MKFILSKRGFTLRINVNFIVIIFVIEKIANAIKYFLHI